METNGNEIILNGYRVSVERANTIMFVQCTVLHKPYSIDTSTDPMSVTIEGYEPDANDMKPDSEFKRERRPGETPAKNEPDATPLVKKCGSCGQHTKQ